MLLSFITGATCFLAGFLWNRLDLAWWALPLLAVGIWLALVVVALLFLVLLCAVVDMKKPQEHDNAFYRKVMGVYVEAAVALAQVKLHLQGMEKLPKEGRYLLVCNHQHNVDCGVLLHVFRNSQLAFVGKKETADMCIINKMMHRTLCLFINRENDREALKTILKCIQLIRDDEASICVFPEGGIHTIGKLSHFRNGAFKIAQRTGVPIVVCTMKNTKDILHNALRLKATDVDVHLVEVIPAEDLKGCTTVDIGNRVYELMISDLGESFRTE